MDRQGIKYHIKSRTKSIYSIWTKMHKQRVPFEGVYDIFALRIIIDCPRELEKQLCWTVYSIVSDCYVPNPERMRDWISIPKSNGYESLHTTVSAKGGKWVEIQIRTERMDAVAERGIAAHWRYKGVNQGAQTSEMWLGQLRELLEEKTHALAERFESKPVSHEIFVFTPNGDIRKLPEGATLLDFAFDIHSGLGSTCSGGKVNNRAVSIREVLRNGDIVEIMTQKNQTPKADWLNVVVTSKARSRIKAYLREEQVKNARMGREELERKLKNWKIDKPIDEAVGYLCKYFKLRTGTELYALVATQKIEIGSLKEILNHWLSGAADEERRQAAAEQEVEKLRTAAKRESVPHRSDALVIDEAINKIEYKLAKCCNPIKGDEIFGFITIGSGITIHRTDCPNAKRLHENYPYRVIEARWRDSGRRRLPGRGRHRSQRRTRHRQPDHRGGEPRSEAKYPHAEPHFARRRVGRRHHQRRGAGDERGRHAHPLDRPDQGHPTRLPRVGAARHLFRWLIRLLSPGSDERPVAFQKSAVPVQNNTRNKKD